MSISRTGRDKSASQYAKARVEQIRKKFGYQVDKTDKENYTISTIQKPSSSVISSSLTSAVKVNQNVKNSSLTSVDYGAQGLNEYNEYNYRIKNIDLINKRIMEVLKQSNNYNIDKPKGQEINQKTTARRHVSQFQNIRIDNPKDRGCAKQDTVSKTINKTPPKKMNQNIDLPKQPGKGQFFGLNIPHSKHTTSVQLSSVPNYPEIPKQNIKQPEPKIQIKNPVFKKPEKLDKSPCKKVDKRYLKPYDQEVSRKQTIKLAGILSEQILKDQKLREAKWVFSEWSSPNKWQLLMQKYNKSSNSKLNMDEIKKSFTLVPEQHNPFFQKSQSITQSCVDELIKLYRQANDFWNHSLKQCVSIENLQKQYFNVKDIDLSKRGYISIEDLVCFVNLYAGNFFRNRDAISIYRKFISGQEAGTQGIKYEHFLEEVTY